MAGRSFPLALISAATLVAFACSGLRDQEIVIDDGNAGASGSSDAGKNSGGSAGDAAMPPGGQGEDDGVGGLPAGGAPSLDGPPTVLSVKPADAADGVSPGSAVRLEFSEELDEATVTAANIQLKDGATSVSGELSYQATTVLFKPDTPLSLLTEYEVSVSADVTDATGVHLAEPFSSSFAVRDGAWDESEVPYASNYTLPGPHAAGVDQLGNVLVAWIESTDVKARWYDAALAKWGPITSLESRAGACSAPRVAVSANGNAVVAFEVAGTPPQTWARRYVDGAWEAVELTVQNPPADSIYLAEPQPVFEGDSALLVWSRREGAAQNAVTYIDAATAGPTGAWKVTSQLDSAPAGAQKVIGSKLSLAVDASGNAILVYGFAFNGGSLYPMFLRYAAALGTWAPAAPLRQGVQPSLGADQEGYGPIVALNPRGDAVTAWVTYQNGIFDLVASHFTRVGGWDAPVPLEKSDGNAFITSGAVAAHGNDFTVVWKQMVGSTFNAYRSTYSDEGKTFGDAALLSSGDSNVWFGEPNVFGDAHGNALAAWSEGGDGNDSPTVAFSRFDALSGKWSDPGKLTTLTDNGYSEARLVGGKGGAAAALLTTYFEGSWTGTRVNLFH